MMNDSNRALLDRYRDMLRIRLFEERVEVLFTEGRIRGTAHPAIGQEAIAVGVAAAMRRGDFATSTHRGHGHFIAMGADPNRMMAELFGKRSGYSGGRGGSQLMAEYERGFLGGNGITGGSIPLATGMAWALKRHGKGGVAVCFFGDGAASRGVFHESLNMASLWTLPVVYVCENNMYAMSTHVRDTVSGPDIALRASAYAMQGEIVDGNDYFAVRVAADTACAHAREGRGPVLLECKTYRLSGHSRGDPCNYRPPDEAEEWRCRDPLERMLAELKKRGALEDGAAEALRGEVTAEVDAAVAFAAADAEADEQTLREGLFA